MSQSTVTVGSESGKFSTNIGEDVIAAAVESVERTREAAAAESTGTGAVDEELAALRARVDEPPLYPVVCAPRSGAQGWSCMT